MDIGPRLAQIALAYAPCSARGPDDAARERYAQLLIRPSDPATTAGRAYYLQNPALSTCALAVLAFWRLAGCAVPEVVDPYYPDRVGRAFSDVCAVAVRCGAWRVGCPVPLAAGDVFVLADDSGNDGHMGLVVGDQGGLEAPFATIEGGQFDGKGSTAVGGFMRRLVEGRPSASTPARRWLMGSRYVIGTIDASLLPIPDLATPDTGDPST